MAKRKGLLLWLAVGLLIFIGAFALGSQYIVVYWDGIDVNEELLMELCGITRDEYFSPGFDHNSCPEAELAVYMIGGREIVWPVVFLFALACFILYSILTGLALVLRGLIRKACQRNQES